MARCCDYYLHVTRFLVQELLERKVFIRGYDEDEFYFFFFFDFSKKKCIIVRTDFFFVS